jgi:Protein of unknown function (DUF2510)/Helix-hairpin-helix motif
MSVEPPGWYPDPTDRSLWRYWDGISWTERRSPRGEVPRPQQPMPSSAPTGRWYFVITLATAGLLAAVPFFHAASRLERPQLRKTGAVMAAGSLLGYTLMTAAPSDAAGEPVGWLSDVAVLILLAVMLVSTLLQIGLRREVYQLSTVATPPSPNEGAIAKVEKARRSRNEARKLAERDPLLARELGIGRPGFGSQYDDGGLLDLNSATAEQLSSICGLPHNLAEAVVTVRDQMGRFLAVEDAIIFGQISEDLAPLVRDRGIVIADR